MCSAGVGDGFAGPVPGVLFHPGQRVENGAFADIRITSERNDEVAVVFSLYVEPCVNAFRAR